MEADAEPLPSPPHPARAWAAWAGVAGALAAAAISVKGILSSGSSTAAIGFVFVPFLAIAGGILAGIWGLALGTVRAHHAGLRAALRPVLVVAWVVAVSAPLAVAWEVSAGWRLQRAVHALAPLEARALEAAFDESVFRRNKFFLGALAQHPQASARLLERIGALPDPELREAMGSVWDVMGENRKGLSVMRLVARHANADTALLGRLAELGSLDLLQEVLRNPRAPRALLERHYADPNTQVQWSLAANPAVSPEVLMRLAGSPDLYVRLHLTWNPGAPVEVLQKLAGDADPLVARNAMQALERRPRGG